MVMNVDVSNPNICKGCAQLLEDDTPLISPRALEPLPTSSRFPEDVRSARELPVGDDVEFIIKP
jgi:hypothetical protein